MTALKTDCIKTSAQELYMCASVHMYVFWGKSNRSDLLLVYHSVCNVNVTTNIDTLLFLIIILFSGCSNVNVWVKCLKSQAIVTEYFLKHSILLLTTSLLNKDKILSVCTWKRMNTFLPPRDFLNEFRWSI